MTPAETLRRLLRETEIIPLPGCFDAMSTKVLADSGFSAAFIGGFGISAAQLAMPDTGLVSFKEVLETVRNCSAVSEGFPLVVDGDTGFGNAINVKRTVREFGRAGAAAVTIEDQVNPKRCGHTKGKQVISRAEAKMKIRAAVHARGDDGPLIVARTDARSVLGFDEALSRCQDFVEEGADIIFLEGPVGSDEMEMVCRYIERPCAVNLLHTGASQPVSLRDAKAYGFKLAIFPVDLLSAAIHSMRCVATALMSGSRSEPRLSFTELQQFVGFPKYFEEELLYATREPSA